MKVSRLLVVGILLLGGCVLLPYTPYGPFGKDPRGGYEERQLGAGRFFVNFRANAHTPAERTYDFTLLRASEIAVREGKKWVIVVEWKKGVITNTAPIHEVYTVNGTMTTGGGELKYDRSELVFDVADGSGGGAEGQSAFVASDEIRRVREKYRLASQ